MYHKGDLVLMKTSKDMQKNGVESDAREDKGYDEGFLKPPFVCLPHSCDAWIIGGPNHARRLIADLENAITRMEKNT